MMDFLTDYILHHADNALILGHRNSEWTGHGPILEQDIALSNIALDLIGQARNFYQLAAARINELDTAQVLTEDDLAYLRDPVEFRNWILVELPNGDWGQTILRQFYFSQFQYLLFTQILHGRYPELKAIAEKSLKEIRYHLKWSSEWVIRLGDGTEESHQRMLHAMQTLNPVLPELFSPADFEYEAASVKAGLLPDTIKPDWLARVNLILETATLPKISLDNKSPGLLSGKKGAHSEHLEFLLNEMQILQRTYPSATW